MYDENFELAIRFLISDTDKEDDYLYSSPDQVLDSTKEVNDIVLIWTGKKKVHVQISD